MSDDVSVAAAPYGDDVVFSFTEASTPVAIESPITIDDVLVTVADGEDAVNVAVTSAITDVAITIDVVSQPISVAVTEAITDVNVEVATGSALWTESFDTVSRNLSGYPYSITYTGTQITSSVFNLGTTTITKTFNYSSGLLTSIVLSGDTPDGIHLTKSFSYTSGKISSVSYS